MRSSKLSGFYKRTLAERRQVLRDWANLSDDDLAMLGLGLPIELAEHMIENVVGIYGLPVGIATNFLVNGRDYLVPMVIEEPSVVAAVSNAAKLFRAGGGFTTRSDAPLMIGQVQILGLDDLEEAMTVLEAHKADILAQANQVGGSIVKRGGGAVDIELRPFTETAIGAMLVMHLIYDVRDAMGANAINTAVEHIAPMIEKLTGGRVNLRILSNLTDKRKAYAEGMIPASELNTDTIQGQDAVRYIVEAGVFAEVDPYRAATHNKGIMNGIDAVVIATGNDWRAVEAGAHAYAARDGRYSSLTRWWADQDGNLRGCIELPLSLGIVGGATKVHPVARLAMKVLDVKTAQELAEIVAAVGLAQNLAAMRALATVGIQQGHMRMHAKQLAVAAGALPEQVAQITEQLIAEKNIRLERAKAILAEISR